MPVQVRESKLNCQLELQHGPIEGVIHLIEVVYSERITFWNAVMQVMPENAKHYDNTEKQLRVRVRLADGRIGYLAISHGALSGGYFEIAGHGTPS